jgi:hypothetical protein
MSPARVVLVGLVSVAESGTGPASSRGGAEGSLPNTFHHIHLLGSDLTTSSLEGLPFWRGSASLSFGTASLLSWGGEGLGLPLWRNVGLGEHLGENSPHLLAVSTSG